MSRFEYSEPFFIERIDAARASAKTMLHELPKTEEDLFNHYKVLLCLHYNLLFFDTRWENYTLDQIALEWFIVDEKGKTKEAQATDLLVTEYKDDMSAIADEMEFGPPEAMPIDESTMDKMKKFMSTGKFAGEK
jgi:hypothetical protein